MSKNGPQKVPDPATKFGWGAGDVTVRPPDENEAPSGPAGAGGVGPKDAQKHIDKLFGRATKLSDVASIIGAPDDARVMIVKAGDGEVHLTWKSPDASAKRSLVKEADGVHLHNVELRVATKGHGLGAAVLGGQVAWAQDQDVKAIHADAVREPEINGHYIWALFGFDGAIPAGVKVPASLGPVKTVSDLMKSREGEAFWKTHGATFEGAFDLSKGSTSRRVWAGYVREKQASGASKGLAAGAPVSAPPGGKYVERPDFTDDDLKIATVVWNYLFRAKKGEDETSASKGLDAGARSKFNQHHGSDGRFTGGHGGGHSVRAQADAARAAKPSAQYRARVVFAKTNSEFASLLKTSKKLIAKEKKKPTPEGVAKIEAISHRIEVLGKRRQKLSAMITRLSPTIKSMGVEHRRPFDPAGVRTKFNPHHDAAGRFASGGSGRGRGRATGEPGKVRSEEHAALRAEQHAERKAEADDIRAERADLRETQGQDLKDHESEQKDNLKDHVKEQTEETRDFHREQKEEARDFEKQQKADARDFEKEQAGEAKEFERGAARDDKERQKWVEEGDHDAEDYAAFRTEVAGERQELHATQKSDRDEFHAGQKNEADEFQSQQKDSLEIHHAEQAGARKDFLDAQASERSDFLEQQRQDARDLREGHQERIRDLVATHRDQQADLLREARDDRDGHDAPSKSLRSKDMTDRGDDGAIPPGDEPEPHEDKTFGLPEGRPIRRTLKRWFRRIAVDVLGNLPALGVPLPHDFPALADYADPMAAAMTPLISAYWDESGKRTRERLGLDPDEWRVVDPHLHQAIVDQSHDFCRSTLDTTALSVRDAYDKLKQEFLTGLVTEGETVPQLRARVQSVFTGLSRDHADLIARTEASRAVHGASLMSAKESGVCTGKRWLASRNSCDRCLELQRKTAENPVPIDEPFLTGQSNNPTYSTIISAPLHPKCRCSFTLVISDAYAAEIDANPPATFAPGAMGPEAQEAVAVAEKPKRERKPKPTPEPEPEPKPVAEAMASGGKYIAEYGPKDRRGDVQNQIQLGTFGGLTPDKFDPDAELARIKDIERHVRQVLTDHPAFVEKIDDDGHYMVENREISVGQSHYFTNAQDRAGWGIASKGGFKMYPVPYTLKEKTDFPSWMQDDFRLDAVYVQVHESHHAFGSHTEFDSFSDAIGLDYHLKTGNTLNPDAVNRMLTDKISWAFRKAQGEMAGSIKRDREVVRFLYSQHPDAMTRAAADVYPSADLAATIKGWKKS